MYYLTVTRDDEDLIRRRSFSDYGAAMAVLSEYYRPKPGRSVLKFTTELVRGQFARSYVYLVPPETISEDAPHFEARHHLAVKQQLAGHFDHRYLFLIESEFGAAEADQMSGGDEGPTT